jgi:hypothetical protein
VDPLFSRFAVPLVGRAAFILKRPAESPSAVLKLSRGAFSATTTPDKVSPDALVTVPWRVFLQTSLGAESSLDSFWLASGPFVRFHPTWTLFSESVAVDGKVPERLMVVTNTPETGEPDPFLTVPSNAAILLSSEVVVVWP